MATIYAVVSPHSKLQIKTEILSPRSTSTARTPTPQRPLRPVNKVGEPGKARRQLAMNLNKGGPVINNRRNARERNRVKQVNQGFAVLRGALPTAQKKQKISKVDTLRGAIDYIQGLSELLASAPARHDRPPPYGYRADASAAYQTGLADVAPAAGSAFQPTAAGYLSEPPSYRDSQRDLRHQRHQLADATAAGRPDPTCPADELVNALRWWHVPVSAQHP